MGFPGGSVVKNPPVKAGALGLISVSGRSPAGGNGNSLQYSCLGKPMVREDWQATVHGVAKTETLKQTHKSLEYVSHYHCYYLVNKIHAFWGKHPVSITLLSPDATSIELV